MQLTGLNWAIPIGISFFTFQAIGYYLDCYHNRIKAEKNAIDYTLFVCFFPQIASGPISKATELERGRARIQTWAVGLWAIIHGEQSS